MLGTYLFEAAGHHIIKAGFDVEQHELLQQPRAHRLAALAGVHGRHVLLQPHASTATWTAPDQPVFLDDEGGHLQVDDAWAASSRTAGRCSTRSPSTWACATTRRPSWGLDGKVGLLPAQPVVSAPGRHLRPHAAGPLEAVRQLRALLRERAAGHGGPARSRSSSCMSATYKAPAVQPVGSRVPADGVASDDEPPCAIGNRGEPQPVLERGGRRSRPRGSEHQAPVHGRDRRGRRVRAARWAAWACPTRGATLNNVIEDMSRDDGTTFFIGNPGKGFSTDFPEAVRNYDGVTLYYQKNFSNQWLAQASYTWSRLRGQLLGPVPRGHRPAVAQPDARLRPAVAHVQPLRPAARRPHAQPQGLRRARVPPHATAPASTWARATGAARARRLNVPGRAPAAQRRGDVHPAARQRRPAALGAQHRRARGRQPEAREGLRGEPLAGRLQPLQLPAVHERRSELHLHPRVRARGSGRGWTDLQRVPGAGGRPCKVIATANGQPITLSDINPNFKRPTAYQAPRSIRLGAKISF